MKKIVLINPPLSAEERGGALSAAIARSIPYGLISLAAVVRNAGYGVDLIDATNKGYDIDETVSRTLGFKPDFVGISIVALSVEKAAKVAEKLKNSNNRIKIIVGGAHASSVPEQTLKDFPAFDISVIGEGEQTITELLDVIDSKNDLSGVQGIVFRRNNEIVRTGQRPFIKDLDMLPLPAWDLLENLAGFYRPSAPSYVRLPSTTIVTSRGCPCNCLFCNSRAIFGRLRCFSAEYVLTMFRYLQKTYGIRDISIYDDNFVFVKNRVEKICRKIIDEKIDLTWSCYSRVDQGDPELFKLMKRAGCWQISYGIESGSQEILDFIRKGVTLEQIKHTLEMTRKAGIRTRGFFIIGHLKETRESIMATIKFMKEVALDDFHFTYFTPLPGTDAYSIADEYGTFDKSFSKTSMQYPVFIPNGLSANEMEKYSKQAYRSFYFRPEILISYFVLLVRFPRNAVRLLNGIRALFSRIFSPNNLSTGTK